MPDISSNQNPKIKLARSLKNKKNRDKTGLFLVEGLHHVGEAVESGYDIEFVIHSDNVESNSYQIELMNQIKDKNISLLSVSENVYKGLSEKENLLSLIAIVKQREFKYSDIEKLKIGVALVTPQDPGNIGSILRSIDAVGADVLFLIDGGADPYHPSCIRASMGTIFWKPIIRTTFTEFKEFIKTEDIKLYGTTAKEGKDFSTIEYSSPTVLLLGSEQKGLSEDQKSCCDELVTIKMRGRVSSLNLSNVASILLYSLKTS